MRADAKLDENTMNTTHYEKIGQVTDKVTDEAGFMRATESLVVEALQSSITHCNMKDQAAVAYGSYN